MRWSFLLTALAFQIGMSAAPLVAAPEGFTTLEIGDQAPDFKLPGVDGRNYALHDFTSAKLLLVVFTCNHCPTAQAYEQRIIQLHADYEDRGVALVAISPNDDRALRLDELGYSDVGDSFADMQIRAKERGFAFPYLYDGDTQKTALAYGVVATPQVFLFDARRKLRYAGRIDDSDVKTVTSQDARNAIDALLAGKPVPVEKTRTFGCSTKWSEKRKEAQASIEKWDREPVDLKTLDEEALSRLMKNDTNQLLLVNVWATWCGPCLTEMPELVDIHRRYRHRNLKLVTISIDEPEQKAEVLQGLQERHVSASNFVSTIPSRDRLADLIDKEWKGPLPYTVLVAPGGKVLFRQHEAIDSLKTRRAIVDFLGRTYASRQKPAIPAS